MGIIGSTEGKKIENETQDEIDKIMNEIESLQKEMGSVETTADAIVEEAEASAPGQVSANPDSMEEFRGSTDDAGMEETLSGLQEEPAAGPTLLDQVAPAVQLVQTNEDKGEVMSDRDETQVAAETAESGSLSITLTGNMTLKLKYEYEGEEVVIGFSDHALKVQMTDGTEFKIPVKRKAANLRRVA